MIRAIPLLAFLVPSFALAQSYIDLPFVVASSLTPSGTNGQCWETVDVFGDQGWGSCSGSGGSGITALTGDVTASGAGSVVATVAKIAGVAVGTPTGTGNIAFSNSPVFTTPNIGTATGSASLDLLLSGGTMTGNIVGSPAIAINSTSIVGSASLYIQMPTTTASNGEIICEHGSTTNCTYLGIDGTNKFSIGQTGGNPQIAIPNAGGVQMSPACGLAPVYLMETCYAQGTVAPTGYAAMYAPNFSQPIWTLRSRSIVVNGLMGYSIAGPSDNTQAFFWMRQLTQTPLSEATELTMGSANAGTQEEHVAIGSKGQMRHAGTAPTVSSCGSSPSAATGADNAFKVTVGSSGTLTGCVITAAAAWKSFGWCGCTDQTSPASIVVEAVLSSTATITLTPYSRTTGIAGSFTASDVVSCGCNYF